MQPMTVTEIASAVKGVWWNPSEQVTEVSAVSTDSRRIVPGCLFLPWVGEKFDGHLFIDAALDAGAVTPATTFDNYPVRLMGNTPWPKNSPNTYTGWTMIGEGVRRSINTIAVQTVEALGVAESYAYATEKLGLSLVPEDMAVSPLAMGGLTYGLSTVEMAAAFSAFANSGVYNSPKMYTEVRDSNGETVLKNEGETHVAMKETTAYFMNQMLTSVVNAGTGTSAKFSGMTIAGKTGTTDNSKTRYFVGYTPYYCAAVWTGYKSNEKISYSGNPAITMWKKVMQKIHEEFPNKDFDKPSTGLETIQVCLDSGLLATDACTHDLRGNRVTTVTVAADTAPTQSCSVHKMVRYCKDGKHLATEYCPASSVVEIAALDWNREIIKNIKAQDDEYLLQTLTGKEEGELCPVHNKKPSIFPIIPGDDDDDDDDTRFGSWSDWWDKLLP